MESVHKNLTIIETENLVSKSKENKEYKNLVNELEYFVNLQEEKITNEVLNELQNLMSRIKKLLELDEKIKEQEIRQEDLNKISNGELFKLVEET